MKSEKGGGGGWLVAGGGRAESGGRKAVDGCQRSAGGGRRSVAGLAFRDARDGAERAVCPCWRGTGEQLIKVFGGKIEAAFPCQCRPRIEVELRELCGIPEFCGSIVFHDDASQVHDTRDAVVELDGNAMVFQIARAKEGDHNQTRGSILWKSLLCHMLRSSVWCNSAHSVTRPLTLGGSAPSRTEQSVIETTALCSLYLT